MKKIIALMLCVIMLVPGGIVFADSLIVNTVKINVNQGTVVINDESIESAAVPYINESGITMMEFYTLADAMGAVVTENEGVFTVTLEGVSMTYTLNSDIVNVEGQLVTMPAQLVRNHYGVVMAPLRFVAEALGADVTYNGETGEIVVVSSGGMDEGIDFQLLFKYSGKTKIGHSKEHWRFNKTDNFDMDSSYDRYYMFAMDDITAELVVIKNHDKTTVEQIYPSMQQIESYEKAVVYEKGIKDHKNTKCAYVKKRFVDSIEELYCFINDEYMYSILIYRDFENFAGAKNDPDVTAFIDSLEFDYNGGDEENTVDIATVEFDKTEEETKDEYVDGNYSWSVKLNDSWTVNEYYGFYNVVTITRPSECEIEDEEFFDSDYMYDSYSMVPDPTITVTVYSNPQNQSLADWVNEKHSIISQTNNPEFCKISPIRDYTVNGRHAKVFEVVNGDGESEIVTKYYYLNDGGYRYSISLYYNKNEEAVSGFVSGAEAVIQSFTPGAINADEVGYALEPDNEVESLKIKIQYDDDNLSLLYPCLWSANPMSDGVYLSPFDSDMGSSYELIEMLAPQLTLLLFGSDGTGVMIKDTSLKYYNDQLEVSTYTIEEYMKKNLAGMLNMSNSYVDVTLESEIKETELMDIKGYCADLSIGAEGEVIYYTMYYLPKDEDSFINIIKICGGSFKNTVYDKAVDEIIESIEFKN